MQASSLKNEWLCVIIQSWVWVYNMMKQIKFFMLYMVAICIVFLPQGKAPMASSDGVLSVYQTYPTPLLKPLECDVNLGNKHAHFDKKQAVVAALGLYLGVKQAVAPIVDIETSLCV